MSINHEISTKTTECMLDTMHYYMVVDYKNIFAITNKLCTNEILNQIEVAINIMTYFILFLEKRTISQPF
jgi:hypothetical protein